MLVILFPDIGAYTISVEEAEYVYLTIRVIFFFNLF